MRARKRTLRTRLATIIMLPRSAVFAKLAAMETKMAEKDAKLAEMEKECAKLRQKAGATPLSESPVRAPSSTRRRC